MSSSFLSVLFEFHLRYRYLISFLFYVHVFNPLFSLTFTSPSPFLLHLVSGLLPRPFLLLQTRFHSFSASVYLSSHGIFTLSFILPSALLFPFPSSYYFSIHHFRIFFLPLSSSFFPFPLSPVSLSFTYIYLTLKFRLPSFPLYFTSFPVLRLPSPFITLSTMSFFPSSTPLSLSFLLFRSFVTPDIAFPFSSSSYFLVLVSFLFLSSLLYSSHFLFLFPIIYFFLFPSSVFLFLSIPLSISILFPFFIFSFCQSFHHTFFLTSPNLSLLILSFIVF